MVCSGGGGPELLTGGGKAKEEFEELLIRQLPERQVSRLVEMILLRVWSPKKECGHLSLTRKVNA